MKNVYCKRLISIFRIVFSGNMMQSDLKSKCFFALFSFISLNSMLPSQHPFDKAMDHAQKVALEVADRVQNLDDLEQETRVYQNRVIYSKSFAKDKYRTAAIQKFQAILLHRLMGEKPQSEDLHYKASILGDFLENVRTYEISMQDYNSYLRQLKAPTDVKKYAFDLYKHMLDQSLLNYAQRASTRIPDNKIAETQQALERDVLTFKTKFIGKNRETPAEYQPFLDAFENSYLMRMQEVDQKRKQEAFAQEVLDHQIVNTELLALKNPKLTAELQTFLQTSIAECPKHMPNATDRDIIEYVPHTVPKNLQQFSLSTRQLMTADLLRLSRKGPVHSKKTRRITLSEKENVHVVLIPNRDTVKALMAQNATTDVSN